MLSIGKVGLGRAQQLYYEQKVAQGAEDYYAGRGEAPGRWAGAGAALLGLSGELDAEQLTALMDGRHPASGEQLAMRGPRSATAAFDLTFSAPKSVSVLFAIGDEQLSRSLVEAHEEAVGAALAYLEREACRVRRGHNGTKREREAGLAAGWQRARSEPAAGFVAAAYRHRMSRAQDPQLHTHVVCANIALGQDGRWTALDASAIYEHAKAGGFVYQAHLRHAVRERLQWAEWGPVRNGMAELVQVPVEVLHEFSQRRRRILEREAQLAAAGVDVAHDGRERIAYDTREAKRDIGEADWRQQVRARAAEHGLGREALTQPACLSPALGRTNVSEDVLAGRLFSPSGLTTAQNTFRLRDVVIAVAGEHSQGAGAEEVIGLARRLLDRPEAVPVGSGLHRRYTTRELLAAEELIVRHAEQGRGRHAGVVDAQQVDSTLERTCGHLTQEQRRVVRAIAGSGNRTDTVEALAGTGKTTCAGALRELYEQAGYRVLGAAPTARAVRELGERAGIAEVRTLDGWAVKLASDPHALQFAHPTEAGLLPQPALLILDEAGMAHTRVSAAVIERAMAANVKVVALGDSGQLSSVQAGGWLGALTRRLGSHELREVMRQRDPEERRALAMVHRGHPDVYLDLKRRRGQLHAFAGEEAGANAEQALIDRWAAACERNGQQEAVMICRDNRRRQRLNELARARLRERGSLSESIEVGERRWAVGERVIARRNDRGRDLDNGMRGTVDAVDADKGLVIQLDAGGVRYLDTDYVREHVEPAYALTGHGMQGATVEWAGVLGRPDDFTRNWSYTALSRAREPVEIVLIDELTAIEEEREQIAPRRREKPQRNLLDRLSARMRERDDEDLALEELDRPEPQMVERVAVSPIRPRLYELDQQMLTIHEQLRASVIEDAKAICRLEEVIGAIEREQARDGKARGWRDRAAHRTRRTERERRLAELHDQHSRLLGRVPDPHAVLRHADGLRRQQRDLGTEHRRLRSQAIDDELAGQPPWVGQTLGPEPRDSHLRDRWHKVAREVAGHRIDQHITDPRVAVSRDVPDRSLRRAISDTRAALGLDAPVEQRDIGIDR